MIDGWDSTRNMKLHMRRRCIVNIVVKFFIGCNHARMYVIARVPCLGGSVWPVHQQICPTQTCMSDSTGASGCDLWQALRPWSPTPEICESFSNNHVFLLDRMWLHGATSCVGVIVMGPSQVWRLDFCISGFLHQWLCQWIISAV